MVTQEELDHAERVVGEFGGDNRSVSLTGTLCIGFSHKIEAGKIIGLTCRVGRAVTGHVDMISDVLKEIAGSRCCSSGNPGLGKRQWV